MKIVEPYKTDNNIIFEYEDTDSFDDLEYKKCFQTYAVCFYKGLLVIAKGNYGDTQKGWGIIGGRIEAGETLEQTLRREVQEESNMKILSFKPIGYQKAVNTKDGSFNYQLRYVCTVEPIGPFVSDPGKAIDEIKLIKPRDYKKYFDWGRIGDRIMDRAFEIMGI